METKSFTIVEALCIKYSVGKSGYNIPGVVATSKLLNEPVKVPTLSTPWRELVVFKANELEPLTTNCCEILALVNDS